MVVASSEREIVRILIMVPLIIGPTASAADERAL